MYNNNNDQETESRQRTYSGAARPMISMKSNRLHRPYVNVNSYAAATFPHCTPKPGCFRYTSPFQYQKRAYSYASAPTYSVGRFTGAQDFPNRDGPSRASSSYIYKNPQNKIQACRDTFTNSRNSRHHNHKNATSHLAGKFDVTDYVIPAMTSNPWAKLEEFYTNRRLDNQ